MLTNLMIMCGENILNPKRVEGIERISSLSYWLYKERNCDLETHLGNTSNLRLHVNLQSELLFHYSCSIKISEKAYKAHTRHRNQLYYVTASALIASYTAFAFFHFNQLSIHSKYKESINSSLCGKGWRYKVLAFMEVHDLVGNTAKNNIILLLHITIILLELCVIRTNVYNYIRIKGLPK